MSDKLKKLETDLAAMNAKQDALRVALETRVSQKQLMVQRHSDAKQSAWLQLANLEAENKAEVTRFDDETTAMQKGRDTIKEHYGDLFELVGQIKKAQFQAE